MTDVNIADFEQKIRKYHSLPEAVIIDHKVIGYPFYRLILDLTYLANRSLEVQEEFVLKGITYSLAQRSELAYFLGVDDHFVEKVLSELISKQLVTKADKLNVTELGIKTLEQQRVLDTVSETKEFYIDAINGKLYDNFNVKKINKNNDNSLKQFISRPRKGHVEDIVDYYDEIQSVLSLESRREQVELIQVNKIEKAYTEWHEIILVFYKNNPDDDEVGYETFSRGSIQTDYRESIEKLYTQGQKVLNDILRFDRSNDEEKVQIEQSDDLIAGIHKDDIETVNRLQVKIKALNDSDLFVESKVKSINKQKKVLKEELATKTKQSKITDIIHTYEHRNYLFKALQEAQHRVMIVSPWIRRNVVDKYFLSILEDSLKRHVNVHILYGIKQKSGRGQPNDDSAIKKLNELAGYYKNLRFEKVKNTHRKILVCDDSFGIVTSFNFLSFRADPSLTYRDELGAILTDKDTIEKLFNSGLSLCESNSRHSR
jgi:hypothetical protein